MTRQVSRGGPRQDIACQRVTRGGSLLQASTPTADADQVIETAVRRWQRYGNDRLYVTARDGSAVGWHDLRTGEMHCDQSERAALLADAVRVWREQSGFPALDGVGAAPQHPVPTSPPMPSGPCLVPDTHADLASRPAGWGPCTKLEALSEAARLLRVPGDALVERERELRERDRALRSPAPLRHFLMAAIGRRTPERAALRDELRDTRRQLRAHADATRGPLWDLAVESESWRTGMHGEVAVGRVLEQLVTMDPRWRVLHGIPVGHAGADIDHLVIGPPGVYTLNTKHHPRANMFVAHDAVMVNGTKYPYVRNSRHEATRAARLLSSACRTPIRTSGVIVPVGIQRFVVKAQPRDVVVIPWNRLIAWLTAGPIELDSEEVEAIYGAARRSRTWRG